MKKSHFLFLLNTCIVTILQAQNVGIGTSTPVSKLTVQTSLNSTGYTHIGDDGTTQVILNESIGGVSASIGTSTNHAFRLQSNNTGRISIYPAGEVVVGANSFGAIGKFTVATSPGNYGITHSDGNIILSTFVGGTQPFAYIGTQSNHALSFYTNNSPSQMILLPNGNVGIGTTIPGSKLVVDGSIRGTTTLRVESYCDLMGEVGIGFPAQPGTGLYIRHGLEAIRLDGNQSFISFYNGTDYKGYLWNKGTDDMEVGTAGVNTNGKLFLSIKGTPYITLHSGGQVSINGPTAGWLPNNGNTALTVTNSIIIKDKANNFNEWALTSNFEDLSFAFNGLSKALIDVSGDYNTLSDIRLKENFHPYKTVLPGIQQLNILTYHYKANQPGKNSFGLIAQNVAEYFPEIVSEMPGKNGQTLLGISYAKTGVLAIKAIQEQQVMIEQQQQMISTLEKRLALLEQKLGIKTD